MYKEGEYIFLIRESYCMPPGIYKVSMYGKVFPHDIFVTLEEKRKQFLPGQEYAIDARKTVPLTKAAKILYGSKDSIIKETK